MSASPTPHTCQPAGSDPNHSCFVCLILAYSEDEPDTPLASPSPPTPDPDPLSRFEDEDPPWELYDSWTRVRHPSLEVGSIISIASNYKVLTQIHEGHFGTVYQAEQQEPISRQVALLLLKPGVDPACILHQASKEPIVKLSRIPKVLEYGRTSTGDPFLMMELLSDERAKQCYDLVIILCKVIDQLEAEYRRMERIELFERIRLYLFPLQKVTVYPIEAHHLGISETRFRIAVHRQRRTFREMMINCIRETDCPEENLHEELRKLMDQIL